MKNLDLKYPPIKNIYPQKAPKAIMQHKRFLGFNSNQIDSFVLYSLMQRNKDNYVKMKCFPQDISRGNSKPCKSLYIHEIQSKIPYTGLGSKMIEFAKRYSKEIGCEGRIHLFATGISISNTLSHVFFKKCGLNTGFPEIDHKLAKLAKKNKFAQYKDFPTIPMFYPPIEHKTIGAKIIKFITKLLNNAK